METKNIIIGVLAILMIGHLLNQLRRDRILLKDFLIWAGIWVLIGFFGMFPRFLDFLMNTTMMEDRMTFLLVASSVLLYCLLYRQNMSFKRLEQRFNRVVQELALHTYSTAEPKGGTRQERAAS